MEEKVAVHQMYEDLVKSYLEIKPVLFDLYIKNDNKYIDAILNEIRALSDHLARCYADNVSCDTMRKELNKAEGHLKRLIYDCFKQLNIIFFDYVNKYESKHFGKHWLRVDGGKFWSAYTSLRYEVVQNVENAKKYESFNADMAFDNYQNAYVLQGEVYDLLEAHKHELQLSMLQVLLMKINSLWGWILTTIILTAIPAIIWEWEKIWVWIAGIFE